MFVNRIPIILTLGQQVKFMTVDKLLNYWAPKLLKVIRLVVSLYNK